MEKELKDLKSVLRSIVVSSPAQVDVRSLQRDYRSMMGVPIPITKYGYRDVLAFLKERCNDCFVFQGMPSNPVLTLIVPDSLKHIDQFVQKQRPSASTKMKGKRRSVFEMVPKPPTYRKPNMVYETFDRSHISKQHYNTQLEVKPPDIKREQTNKINNTQSQSVLRPPDMKREQMNNSQSVVRSPYIQSEQINITNNTQSVVRPSNINSEQINKTNNTQSIVRPPDVKTEQVDNSNNTTTYKTYNSTRNLTESSTSTHNLVSNNGHVNTSSHEAEDICNGNNVRNFFKKRLPMYDSSQYVDSEPSGDADRSSSKEDNDSGRQTSSSHSSTKRAQLEELKCEIYELIDGHENGVLCTDLMRLYRERYARELSFHRFGHNNLNSLLCSMQDRVAFVSEAGGVRLRLGRAGPAARPGPRARAPGRLPAPRALPVDPDDALPGIDFDPDVFPEDCMHFMESIPALALGAVRAGAMLAVAVGEVYSPSHFWLQLLGDQHSAAMERLMDEMAEYYTRDAGRARLLARGALRPGHYCSSLYDGDWHRSLIVKVLDADTVKVRHVDYGTVDTVGAGSLRPLLRRWAALPAQAVRARLAGLRPGAGGRRWPHAAAAHLLHLVRDKHFVANVVAVDPEEDIIETFLIDTSGADDVCVTSQMIRAGHADARPDSALRAAECYLYPRFEALESGATPNFAEIHRYLADGISLEYVEAYRLHVPAAMPAPASPPAPPAPAPLELLNRVPLLRLDSPPPAAPAAPRSPSPAPAAVSPPPPAAPPVAPPGPQWPRPALLPTPGWSGAPPPGWGGSVQVSVQECEMYSVLSALDPEAAHCYMLSALRRAAAGSLPAPPAPPLNPHAPEFRTAYPPPPLLRFPPQYGRPPHAPPGF